MTVADYKWDTDKAIDFARMISELVIWAHGKGYYLIYGEVQRFMSRMIEIYGHERQSFHLYCRAGDMTLYVEEDGKLEWIEDAEHPAWQEIADQWESIGGRSGRAWDDLNHLELP